MSKKHVVVAITVIIASFCEVGSAQTANSNWNGKTCAVSLTYDDALNVHLDNAIPVLDSLGLKATFYLSGFFPSFRARATEWKSVAANGHELGNHTLFHPCDGTLPGRDWVKPDYDLSTYTAQRLIDEITMANVLLSSLDGKTARTFAYPCGETAIRGVSYTAMIQDAFVAARGVQGKIELIDTLDLYTLGSYLINGQSGDDLIALVKQAMEQRALVVFLFHGVGGEHNLNVSLDAHRALLQFLKEKSERIWVAPLVEIAEYVRETHR